MRGATYAVVIAVALGFGGCSAEDAPCAGAVVETELACFPGEGDLDDA